MLVINVSLEGPHTDTFVTFGTKLIQTFSCFIFVLLPTPLSSATNDINLLAKVLELELIIYVDLSSNHLKSPVIIVSIVGICPTWQFKYNLKSSFFSVD